MATTNERNAKNFEAEINSITSSIKHTFRTNDALRKTVTKELSSRAAASIKITKQAQRAFASFNPSRVSNDIRQDPSYLHSNDDLKGSQDAIIKRDIEALANSNVNHLLHLTLSDKDVAEYKLKKSPTTNGAVTIVGNIPLKDIVSLIEEKSQATELFSSSSDAQTPCNIETEAERIIANSKSTTPASSPDSGSIIDASSRNKTTSPLTAETLVKEKVNLQMHTVTSPETQLSYGVSKRADENDIRTTIQAFEIKGGPADVTSYHDFYRLRIAFEHMWSELLDDRLRKWGTKLYEEWVKLKAISGINEEDKSISTADELRDFIYRIRTMSELTAENDARFYTVKGFISEIIFKEWIILDETSKQRLYDYAVAGNMLSGYAGGSGAGSGSGSGYPSTERGSLNPELYKEYQASARWILKTAKPSRVIKLMDDLEKILSEGYAFDIFAKDSINFGVLATYRQEWKPLNYQVGDLVSTIPLAPQEAQKYTKKIVEKKKRSVKEIDEALQIRKKEASSTSRVDAEIVQKAQNKSNFKVTADGSVNMKLYDIHASVSMDKDQSKESAETKKQFREDVLKSAEEYKHEHKLEISTEESQETEITTSHEIKNPNDELPVTYLFYELQRTYEISEKIHKITPVVLVANDVPAPHEINESWLMSHDWILKRAILDDSFLPALEYLSKNFVGDEISIEALRVNMERQAHIVEEIGQQIRNKNDALSIAQSGLDKAVQYFKNAQSGSGGGDERNLAETILDPINIGGLFSSASSDKPDYEAYRLSVSSAQEALERAYKQADQLRSQLEIEMTALQTAVDKYSTAAADHFNHQTETDRLRVHIKDNILHYMQAIWDYEPPDQRYFRLYKVTVPVIQADLSASTYGVDVKKIESHISAGGMDFGEGTKKKYKVGVDLSIPPYTVEHKKLVEVADLENLLGYKGNYMIFPLKENNYLTYYMMQDYIDVDQTVALRDPDEYGNYSIDEIKEFMKCLYKKDLRLFKRYEEQFRELIIRRLSSPIREKDLVIVPTNSLYIEALPGKHPLLEDFKLIHRALDVKKVQAEVRHAELENVRLASRALKGKLEDPDIEKKIIINGDGKKVAVVDDS
ncbi:hypothetical protein BH18THE2_BH18THE2_29400 [soil metagenome]